jgi:anti-sigma regulatory factor (Ser/Thr protein kinase)
VTGTRDKVYCREVLASKAAAGLARSGVKGVLLGLGLAGAIDDGCLIMGELVNNAVAVSPNASTIRIFAGLRARGLVVAVWDADQRMPQRRPMVETSLEELDLRPENFDRNGGWGLGIVTALAKECWVERTEPGKWVCASLDV